MFIIIALMTIPVGIAGFFIWPGTPNVPSRSKWFISEEEFELARTRLRDDGSQEANEAQLTKFSWKLLRAIFTDPKIYYLSFLTTLYWNANGALYGGFPLWLASLGRYSASKINSLASIPAGLGLFFIPLLNVCSDLFLGPAGAITVATSVNLVVSIILAVWHVPESATWFAFSISWFTSGMSPVLYGWANHILRHNDQQRAITLVLMTAIAQSMTAWIPLLTFKTVEAPEFHKGYIFCCVVSGVLILFTWVVFWLVKRDE
jgi:hypothetical protein